MTYDDLLLAADSIGLVVKEKQLRSCSGRIKGNKIAIKKDLSNTNEKACVLAEEIGHHLTTVGNILDQRITINRKQELKARALAFDIQIGLDGIIEAYEAGCVDFYMAAEYLNVTEEFFKEAIEFYKNKYGVFKKIDNYIIYFIPSLTVMKLL